VCSQNLDESDTIQLNPDAEMVRKALLRLFSHWPAFRATHEDKPLTYADVIDGGVARGVLQNRVKRSCY
jgi:hypothetical protein